MASMVSMPSRRVSSCPVAIGKVRQSTTMSDSDIPQRPVRSAISRSAIATLCSRVRAWPCSSMVSATTAAPCSSTSAMIRMYRESGPSPSSKFTELTMDRPPSCSRPAWITGGSVESIMIGSVDAVASRDAIAAMSAAPSRPT